ncbi:MAG TPA: phosphatase domain-containing protein [Gemmatirosa sp.]|nr:phosphatase domain-containing protein [Gemmatirosa sp.]
MSDTTSPPPASPTRTALHRAAQTGARHLAGALARLRAGAPAHVAGYRGYATGGRALVLARVLQGAPLAAAEATHSRWRNLLDALRRIESDPLAHVALDGRLGAHPFHATSDDEGFVRQWVPLSVPLPPGEWHAVTLAPAGGATLPPGLMPSVLAPAATARFGIVSDLDDTVLQSDATRLLNAARLLLLENARTRLPFPGVAALYRALVAGATGAEGNPVFYVSSSPWNLYDVIADFLDVQQIPTGPLLLRDWDLGRGLARHGTHKRAAIAELLDAYPSLPFLLVGDSGQEDPEIYRAIAGDFPGRVLGVWIRSVARAPERIAAVRALADELAEQRIPFVLADDSAALAADGVRRGWLGPDAVTAVDGSAQRDAARPAVPLAGSDDDAPASGP